MESTGKAGAIQVTEETCEILQAYGYTFEQRGLVAVKGKGQLMTYYLQGKVSKPASQPNASPMLANISTMDVLQEVEEPKDIEQCNPLSDSPCPPITLSSATVSPNSVRLNQNYQSNEDNSQLNGQLEQDVVDIVDVIITDPEGEDITESTADGDKPPEAEATENEPLLSKENSNSIPNVDTANFSNNEKDSLLENAN